MDTDTMLKEQTDRGDCFMVLAARRPKGKMAPVLFRRTREQADSSAEALKATGWHKAEVWALQG